MSFVTRRALSTLIPPKVRKSPFGYGRKRPVLRLIPLTEFELTQAIGAAPDAIRMQRVVSFYEKLPRGAAPEIKAKGLLGRYQAKHFGKNPTGKPIIHLIVFLVSIGYVQNYYFHLRHHKNNAH
ncbi:probable mitochondrial ATP synthase subunit f [Fusarium torulosum]|uniref:Probable mitochondrial ATP synthase subunit f n=1 Tax=Fusarium torulosum TaxID=33205 RepID=A0AAE8MFF5_9HYPO|nr:probable mitochondrial ATP synthase subunit f [Fusarium torulosum]